MLRYLSSEEVEQLLESEVVGRLACHARGRTYVVPITYAYEADSIICRSAEGQKLQMMRENPEVCFEVDRIDDLANWRSVVAWGRYEELSGPVADHALARLMGRLLPLTVTAEVSQTPKALTGQHRAQSGLRAVMFRIRLTEKTGRFEDSADSD